MEIDNSYLGKMVQIIIDKNFTYVGKIVEINEHSIIFIDNAGRRSFVSTKYIEMIKEID